MTTAHSKAKKEDMLEDLGVWAEDLGVSEKTWNLPSLSLSPTLLLRGHGQGIERFIWAFCFFGNLISELDFLVVHLSKSSVWGFSGFLKQIASCF